MRLLTEDVTKLHQVKSLLETDYKYHYSLYSISKRFHIGSSKLKVGFLLLFKMPIYEYLVCVRIEKAKWFLENTDDPIKTIADKVGYDYSNFQKQFKKHTNMVPLQWRKEYKYRYSKLACAV